METKRYQVSFIDRETGTKFEFDADELEARYDRPLTHDEKPDGEMIVKPRGDMEIMIFARSYVAR